MQIKPVMLLITFLLFSQFSLANIIIGLSSENGEALKYIDKRFTGELKSAYTCVVNELNEHNEEFSVIPVPQARLIKMLQSNAVDIAMPLLLLPIRDEFAQPSSAIYKVNYQLITHPYKEALSKELLISKLNESGLVYKRGTGARTLIFRYLGLDIKTTYSYEHQVETWHQAVQFVQKNRAALTAVPSMIAKDIPAEYFVGLERVNMPSHELGLYMSNKFAQTHTASKIYNASERCQEHR